MIFSPRCLLACTISLILHGGILLFLSHYSSPSSGAFTPEQRTTKIRLSSGKPPPQTEIFPEETSVAPPPVSLPPEEGPLRLPQEEAEALEESPPLGHPELSATDKAPIEEEERKPFVPENSAPADFALATEPVRPLVPLGQLTPRGPLAAPPYPARARRLGYQGRVVLELTISPEGRVKEVRIVESEVPEILIEGCRTTVLRRWAFIPPGKEVVARKTFRFRLNG